MSRARERETTPHYASVRVYTYWLTVPVREDMDGIYKLPDMEITKTDMAKIVQYLVDSAALYDALPMQKCKSRAFMIRQLLNKIRKKNNGK